MSYALYDHNTEQLLPGRYDTVDEANEALMNLDHTTLADGLQSDVDRDRLAELQAYREHLQVDEDRAALVEDREAVGIVLPAAIEDEFQRLREAAVNQSPHTVGVQEID